MIKDSGIIRCNHCTDKWENLNCFNHMTGESYMIKEEGVTKRIFKWVCPVCRKENIEYF